MSPPPSVSPSGPTRGLGLTGVCISAVALVVSASTLSTDLTGLALLGGGYALALAVGLIVVALVAVSTCDLALCHPRAGGIYHYARAVVNGRRGQQIGLFLALLFLGTFLFAAAAETKVTAEILRQAARSELPLNAFVLAIGITAVAANAFGLRAATGITGALLVIMLGVRWWMGLAGFFGWSDQTPVWAAERLMTEVSAGAWIRSVLGPALALGLWTFVGLEGSCALVEDVKRPSRTLPRALALAALTVLGTSLVLTLGLGGALPPEVRIQLMDTAVRRDQAPALVVGEALFGRAGGLAMAAAAFASTASTLIIALAAVPRMIMVLARDGLFFGRLSLVFARTHPRTGAPLGATLLVGALYLGVACGNGSSLHGVYAAAYLFFFRYAMLHLLALLNARHDLRREQRAPRWVTVACAGAGLSLTLAAWYLAFSGRHALYSSTAGAVAGGALVLAMGAWGARRAGSQVHSRPSDGLPVVQMLRTSPAGAVAAQSPPHLRQRVAPPGKIRWQRLQAGGVGGRGTDLPRENVVPRVGRGPGFRPHLPEAQVRHPHAFARRLREPVALAEPLHDLHRPGAAHCIHKLGPLGHEGEQDVLIGIEPGPVTDDKAILDGGEVTPQHGVQRSGAGDAAGRREALGGQGPGKHRFGPRLRHERPAHVSGADGESDRIGPGASPRGLRRESPAHPDQQWAGVEGIDDEQIVGGEAVVREWRQDLGAIDREEVDRHMGHENRRRDAKGPGAGERTTAVNAAHQPSGQNSSTDHRQHPVGETPVPV